MCSYVQTHHGDECHVTLELLKTHLKRSFFRVKLS